MLVFKLIGSRQDCVALLLLKLQLDRGGGIIMAGFTIQERFEIQEQRRGEITLLFIKGRMDKPELDVFNAALTRLRKEGRRRVVVDFSEVTGITTLTVAGFVMGAEALRGDGGEMVLTGISRSISKVFEVIDSTHKLEMQTDVVAAIKSMTQRSVQALDSA
jgi:anti-anti-sigma regulatory factor